MLPIAVLVASTVGWMALEAAASLREPHQHLPRELATGLALLAVHAAAIGEHAVRGTTAPPLVFAIACALLAAGIALRIFAIRALGPAFVSPTTAPWRRVRRGPYRVMRHPSEIGLLAAAAGAAALLSSVVAAAVIAVGLAPLILLRCAAEDRALAHGLADPRWR